MPAILPIIAGLGVLAGASLGGASARYYLGSRRADHAWATSSYSKLEGVGAVKSLSILPLIDWYAGRDDLVGEPGVSYLVRADDITILLDTGINLRGEHPSPLLRNMAALGVAPSDIDIVVVSHNHLDHCGGRMGTVALSAGPVDLPNAHVYVPTPMTAQTENLTVVHGPRHIAPGVVSTGPIANQDFMMGWTVEQSLAINVEGKGVVAVIGCGHPRVDRIMDRAETLLGAPIYGVIGGLHYPVTASRWMVGPLPMQMIFGTGKWPWDRVSPADVEKGIASIMCRHPKLVALSAHDSCDWSLDAFRTAFPDAHQEVKVGREIVVC